MYYHACAKGSFDNPTDQPMVVFMAIRYLQRRPEGSRGGGYL